MNKGLKKGLKITGVTVAVILVFMLVLPFMFKDKVITIVKKEANEMLNAKLDFESLDISLFSHFPSASIELNGLTLSGIDDFENDTLVSAESIDVAVNVMSLFSDKGFDVNYVVLDKPSIKAVKLADGRVNWDIMKPDTADVEEEKTVEVEGESSFRLKLKNFKIADATIVYVDDSTHMQFYTDKLNLKLSGDMSADMTDIDSKLSCKDIYFAMGGISYLKQAEAGAKLTVSADLKNNKFILKENTLSLNAIVLNLDGWVALLDDGAMDMDLKINTSEINFKEILSLIPVTNRIFECVRNAVCELHDCVQTGGLQKTRMSTRHVYNAGNGEISDCRQFLFYAFSGQDRTIVDRDKPDVGAASERRIDSDDKWIFIIALDIM